MVTKTIYKLISLAFCFALFTSFAVSAQPVELPVEVPPAAVEDPAAPSNEDLQLATSLQAATALSTAFERVAKLTTPSLVNISSVKKTSKGANPQNLDPFKEFFGEDFIEKFFPEGQIPQQGEKGDRKDHFQQNGMGTGFLIDTEGHIITNNHVIAGADEVQVTFADDRKFKAKIIGVDDRTDLAVIKVEAPNLRPLNIGNSDSLKIGEWVIAAGSPFGLSNSITAGIVSAKGRSIMGGSQYEDFIQTDAAINPGNSGGPLLNINGEVVGVNTAIYSRSGGYMGIGFAIPSNMVKQIMASLIKFGKVSRGWLGVVIQPLNEELRAEFSYKGKENGILIGDVTPDGPAAKSGLKEGDIVMTLDEVAVEDVNQFRNLVASKEPGKKVNLKIFRAGAEQNLKVKLGELEKEEPKAAKVEDEVDILGLSVQSITPELKLRLGLETDGTVIVTAVEPFSVAAEASIQINDVILKVAGQNVKNADHFYEVVKKADLKKGVLLIVESGGMKRFVVLKGE